MRKVPLRTIKEAVYVGGEKPQELELSYLDIFSRAIHQPGPGGLRIDEIKRRISLVDKLDKARASQAGHLLLEEQEHELLVGLIKEYPFGAALRSAVQLMEELEYAAQVEVEVAEGE